MKKIGKKVAMLLIAIIMDDILEMESREIDLNNRHVREKTAYHQCYPIIITIYGIIKIPEKYLYEIPETTKQKRRIKG